MINLKYFWLKYLPFEPSPLKVENVCLRPPPQSVDPSPLFPFFLFLLFLFSLVPVFLSPVFLFPCALALFSP